MATNTNNVKVVISAEDTTKKGIKSAEKNMSSLGSTAMKLGTALAGALAVKQVITFGKESVKAFVDAEAAMKRVETTIENTLDGLRGPEWTKMVKTLGELTGSTDDFDSVLAQVTSKIQDMSAAVVRLGFDDEDAAESIARFFQRTQDLTKAQELNVIAMDLARAKNIELSDAADMVNLVLSGQGRALKQYGIELDETMTPLEALGALHDKVRGQAEAFGDTTAGKMEALNVAYGNLKETIGGMLAEALTPLLTGFVELVQVLDTSIPSLTEMKDSFFQFLELIDSKTGLISLLRESFQNVSDVIQYNLWPAIQKLWEALQPLQPFMEALVFVFGTMLVIALGAAIKAIEFFLILSAELIKNIAETATMVMDVLNPAFDWMGDKIAKVTEAVIKLINKFKELDVLGGLKSSVSKIFGGGRAVGGPVTAGRPYMVGENGPEMFTPQGYGRITKSSDLGGGGLNITLTGNTFMGREGIAEQISADIVKILGRSTKLSY